MKSAALLFGLNYQHMQEGKLQGCINDVNAVATFLEQNLKMPKEAIEKYTDDVNRIDTSYKGILQHLYQFAIRTWKEDLDFAWIHYSGHGSAVADTNKDEQDGKDETLCPSDYDTMGDITDDVVCDMLKSFNPRTTVVMVIDACHSGTMGDLKYKWDSALKKCVPSGKDHGGRIVLLSGCMDQQTSADATFLSKPGGALTYCLMQVLKNPMASSDIFVMLDSVRKMLSIRGFSQIPELTSSVDLLAPGVPKWFIPTEQDILSLVRPITTTQQMQTQVNQAQAVSQAMPSNRFKRCFGL
jgi:hypothetical protein